MTDVIKLTTTNLIFSATVSWKRVYLGDFNSERQPEMATETGNTFTSETMRDKIEIPTANLGYTTMWSSKSVGR